MGNLYYWKELNEERVFKDILLVLQKSLFVTLVNPTIHSVRI